jgi:hypothetical protein
LDELLGVCRKHGVTVFTDGHVRIAFAPSGAQVPQPAHSGMVPVKAGHRPMTDTERFLFAATEGYPDDDESIVPVPSDAKS